MALTGHRNYIIPLFGWHSDILKNSLQATIARGHEIRVDVAHYTHRCLYLKLSDLFSHLAKSKTTNSDNYLITTISTTALIEAACTTLTRAFHKLLGNFLATFCISSKFFRFEQIFALWAISSFLQILRYRNNSLSFGHAYILRNVSNTVEFNLWFSCDFPLGQIIGERYMQPGPRSAVF